MITPGSEPWSLTAASRWLIRYAIMPHAVSKFLVLSKKIVFFTSPIFLRFFLNFYWIGSRYATPSRRYSPTLSSPLLFISLEHFLTSPPRFKPSYSFYTTCQTDMWKLFSQKMKKQIFWPLKISGFVCWTLAKLEICPYLKTVKLWNQYQFLLQIL